MPYLKLQAHLKNLVDHSSMSLYQVVIVAICFILNMNDGIDVLVVSFSGSEILNEWGISKTLMGYIFSAGLLGMTLGAFFLAPLGDKIGRRKVFIASLILISSGMFLVSACDTYYQMLIFRFITGLGIGGILPTLATTASEFSNEKYRDFNVSLVQAGWPLGAIFTGFFCAWAIPLYGWRFAFLVAGIVSSLMLVGVILFMTDSIEYLLKKQPENAHSKINGLLIKMKHKKIEALPENKSSIEVSHVSRLFTREYKNSTLTLWIAVFFGFMTLYTLMSWVPNLAEEAGLPFKMATYVGVALNAGAVIGTALLGMVAAKFGLRKTILGFMLLAFLVMVIYGNISLSTGLIMLMIFAIGTFVQGGFNGMYATISRVYPAEIRTTGMGLSIGVGRFGAILGPTLFGVLSDSGMKIPALFTLFSVPLLITGFAAFSLKSNNLK